MLLIDKEIELHCMQPELWFDGRPLIAPYVGETVQNGVISYGVTSMGYDLRLSDEVWVFDNMHGVVCDPKRFKDEDYVRSMFRVFRADPVDRVRVSGGSYVLVKSAEYLSLPWWLKGRCVGKSTYARCGVIANMTPLEPEWHGYLTIEMSIANPCTVQLYDLEGVLQVEFDSQRHDFLPPGESRRPRCTYADKKGKYQGQTTVTPPRMHNG